MRDDAPVQGTRRTVTSAVVAAVRLLRARWKAVLVTVLCIYAALSWTMPLMTSLVRATLAALGISGVNLYTLDTVAASPWALLVLVGIAGAATLFALLELTLFAAIAHLVLEGERLTFTRVAGRAGATARKAAGWQGLLLIPYLTVLLPVSGVGFSSVLTERVALPKFVTGELLKSTPGAALYVVVGGAVTYLMLRLLLVPGLVSLPGVTIAQALRGSLRMTTWRMLLGFGAVMLSTLLVATVILLPLARHRTASGGPAPDPRRRRSRAGRAGAGAQPRRRGRRPRSSPSSSSPISACSRAGRSRSRRPRGRDLRRRRRH